MCKANKLTTRMNDSSHMEGLKLLAQQDPSSICTNASLAERTYGAYGAAMLSCGKAQADDAGPLKEWPLTMTWRGDNGASIEVVGNLLGVVAALESCRAIKGFYTAQHLLQALDTPEARSQINGNDPTSDLVSTVLYRKVNAPNMAHISTIVGVLQSNDGAIAEFGRVLVCPSCKTTSPSQAALWLVGNEYAALARSGRPMGYDIESRLYMPANAQAESSTASSSAWKGRDMVMRVVGKNWPASSMWLHLHQEDSTATCVVDFLHKRYPGAKQILANCSNGYVASSAVVPYSCSKGVEDTAMQKAEQFMLIAKRRNTVSFLLMQDLNSDDVYAIYTGALGSVFAAVACVAATVFLVVVVLVWRLLVGRGTDACRCGIAQ